MYEVLIKETNEIVRGPKAQELTLRAINELDLDLRELVIWHLHHGYSINYRDIYISEN